VYDDGVFPTLGVRYEATHTPLVNYYNFFLLIICRSWI